ncbi:hypothetical protein KCP76_02355 [Salmonella enterica subsp. enterica serovar Weltevreden]|nr:hypothetical protein KCP76_02355 [Salmonella enterica subsp. enterica serovar Weltevreden]
MIIDTIEAVVDFYSFRIRRSTLSPPPHGRGVLVLCWNMCFLRGWMSRAAKRW